MGIDLNPAPRTLGLAAPVLGPWFAPASVRLGAPDEDLAVPLTFGAETRWLPPANGLLSLYVSTQPRPSGIAGLRKADGAPAFAEGKLVAVFRLLPEVEERLDALTRLIPSAHAGAGATSAVPTRQRVRALALELATFERDVSSTSAPLERLERLLPPGAPHETVAGNVRRERLLRARSFGLDVTAGGLLVSHQTPMSDLMRPGRFSIGSMPVSGPEWMLLLPAGTQARLWAFDARGRAVDPGAVAAWWRYLAATAVNGLWAEGAETRTAEVAPRLTLHLVNAHEGPLNGRYASLLARVTTPAGWEGTGALRTRRATGAARMEPTAAPSSGALDDAPHPRMAVLPHGEYGGGVTVWESGTPAAGLERDYVRVAVVDVEEHLVGRRRTDAGHAGRDQGRASTRVRVARTEPAGPLLLTNVDDAAREALAVFDGEGVTRMVAPVVERDWGPFPEAPLPDVPPPDAPPPFDVHPLVAGDSTSAGVNQRALFELTLGADLAGAWVRVWPLGFDSEQATRVRLDGGAGRADAAGRALVALTLPDGTFDALARLGADLQVTTARGSRLFTDVRFARPRGGSAPVDIAALPAGARVVVCETGAPASGGDAPPGATLVVEPGAGSTAWTQIDRARLRAQDLAPDTLARKLSVAGRRRVIELTEPAFRQGLRGDDESLAGVAGVSAGDLALRRVTRTGMARVTSGSALMASSPLPTQERLEVACSRVHTSGARAVVASAPPLSRYHERGMHREGHPGVPAAVETHATGVRLAGPAALLVAEALHDRTARGGSDWIPSTAALVEGAWGGDPAQADPTSATAWAAVLRTVAADVEGEAGLGFAVRRADGARTGVVFDTAETLVNAVNAVTGAFGASPLPPSAYRALARRSLAAAYGLREGAASLLAAVGRAEDFVYLETPALDALTFGRDAEAVSLLSALARRMDERPALRVVLCVPQRHLPGTPALISRLLDRLTGEAIWTLSNNPGGTAHTPRADRVAAFSPGAGVRRPLRLASTTVVVDDAYALTGTTHLSRRGLSFDSSLAVAVFDERLADGRPAAVRDFRRTLIAARLSLRPTQIPDDPAELVEAIRLLSSHGGAGRLVHERPAVAPAAGAAASADPDILNPDGSHAPGASPALWFESLLASSLLAGDTSGPA